MVKKGFSAVCFSLIWCAVGIFFRNLAERVAQEADVLSMQGVLNKAPPEVAKHRFGSIDDEVLNVG